MTNTATFNCLPAEASYENPQPGIDQYVLDPFLGSGTTSLAAKNTDRNSIGFEINSEFTSVIREKLNVFQKDLEGTIYDFVIQPKLNIDFRNEIEKLQYVFKDPQTLDKKIDLKKLQFGSKIDKDSRTPH